MADGAERQQTRRRGAALEEAILRAAVEELTASGYAGLTMDKVAARAGTNKNALYRRWPHRLALGIAAYRRLATAVQPPDTGSLRGDVLALLHGANRHWSSPLGAILRELMAAAGGATELLAQLQDQSADATAAPWLTVLGRAVARGRRRRRRCIPGSPRSPSSCCATSSWCAGCRVCRTRCWWRSSTRCTCPWYAAGVVPSGRSSPRRAGGRAPAPGPAPAPGRWCRGAGRGRGRARGVTPTAWCGTPPRRADSGGIAIRRADSNH